MEKITFSFGKNWQHYLETIDERSIASAEHDLVSWLGLGTISGKTVLDVGSGSGIHSLCFHRLKAKKIVSFDYDQNSVEATRTLWKRSGQPAAWEVCHGSILDMKFVSTLSKAEIVYSWGVLHHTGDMWTAIDNAANLVADGGKFFISIYSKGPKYERHLALKKAFNRSGNLGKRLMVYKHILRKFIIPRLRKRQNPFTWNQKKTRGMDVYHDVIDWLGGLPYEVAYESEISEFLAKRGFVIVKKALRNEGACHRLLYEKIRQSDISK